MPTLSIRIIRQATGILLADYTSQVHYAIFLEIPTPGIFKSDHVQRNILLAITAGPCKNYSRFLSLKPDENFTSLEYVASGEPEPNVTKNRCTWIREEKGVMEGGSRV